LKKDRKYLIAIGLILVILSSAISFGVSTFVYYASDYLHPKYTISFDPNEVDIEVLKKFNTVRSVLKEYFYKDVDENVLMEGAIEGMVNSLNDRYTVYFTKEELKEFLQTSGGYFVGIGVSVIMNEDDILTVAEVYPDSPALKAGIQKDDMIIEVDGEDVTTIKDQDLIVSKIRGEENTTVKIKIYRPSEKNTYEFDIVRKSLKVENIKSEILPGNIGYIRIVLFDSEIAEYFNNHLNNLLAQGIKGLIIDLRDNSGGLYDQVVRITDRLIPQGLIVYTEDRNGNKEEEWSDSKELDMPMAVLINGRSASASEIMAGAIKDHKKGILVGNKTFGKGLVQVPYSLPDGSGLKITIARYFTPSGVCIQDIGINPDIEVSLDEKYQFYSVSLIPREDDTQLQKAIEELQKQINAAN